MMIYVRKQRKPVSSFYKQVVKLQKSSYFTKNPGSQKYLCLPIVLPTLHRRYSEQYVMCLANNSSPIY